MKFDKYFNDFINKELEKDYYYNVERVCRNMSGNNGYKWYYEVFISNLKEVYEDADMVLVERFIDYLDKNGVEYDKEYYADVIDYLGEFVSVYDADEYIGDEKHLKKTGDYKRKVKEFLLADNCDNFYTDLITFDTEVDLEELKAVIYSKMDAMQGEYTNEDIYDAIDTLGVGFTIKWLGNLEKIEY